ncbi:MAG: hypothetical protein ACPIOQ_81230 [Promethearchaeia archaeon]
MTALHTHIAWDMDDGGLSTQSEQDGPYGANDWHCKLPCPCRHRREPAPVACLPCPA